MSRNTKIINEKMVGLGRFELPTHGLGNRCSIHLSYRPTRQLRAEWQGEAVRPRWSVPALSSPYFRNSGLVVRAERMLNGGGD